MSTDKGSAGSHLADAVTRQDRLSLLLQCIDLTSLEAQDTDDRIRALCALAVSPGTATRRLPPVAAVCVYPAFVETAAKSLTNTGVAVAAVAGAFPTGHTFPSIREQEIHLALQAGATEIDFVLDRGAMLCGDLPRVREGLRQARSACLGHPLKIILETGELRDPALIRQASTIAMEEGADFIKTSTGKSPIGATPEAAFVMLESIRDYRKWTGRTVGFKVSGGVRTVEQASVYLDLAERVLGRAWLTPARLRFGASTLLGDVVDRLATTV